MTEPSDELIEMMNTVMFGDGSYFFSRLGLQRALTAVHDAGLIVYAGERAAWPNDQRDGAVAEVRKLAAHAAYAVDGTWPQYDPWPDRLDELCDELRDIGDRR